MSIKKKMGMGIMAGALGVSLIGGGTWAAFNDVESIDNTFAAGTLDLSTGGITEVFNMSNLKPGDYFSKSITLTNNGTLNINKVLTTVNFDGWEDKEYSHLPDNGDNELADFLNQFEVTIKKGTTEIWSGHANELNGLSNYDLTGSGDGIGLESGDEMELTFDIKFKEDFTTYDNSRYQVQNKYQNEGATVNITFEATQMPGEDRSNNN